MIDNAHGRVDYTDEGATSVLEHNSLFPGHVFGNPRVSRMLSPTFSVSFG